MSLTAERLREGRLCGACHAAVDLAEKRPELFVSTDAPPSRKFALSLRVCGAGAWFQIPADRYAGPTRDGRG
jgi:hypothetical protein